VLLLFQAFGGGGGDLWDVTRAKMPWRRAMVVEIATNLVFPQRQSLVEVTFSRFWASTDVAVQVKLHHRVMGSDISPPHLGMPDSTL
jgi:hypothetical protein